jgi:hypothetical protein
MAEYVLVPIGGGKAKRLEIPAAVSNGDEGAPTVDAYLAAPPQAAWDAAAVVDFPDAVAPKGEELAPADDVTLTVTPAPVADAPPPAPAPAEEPTADDPFTDDEG